MSTHLDVKGERNVGLLLLLMMSANESVPHEGIGFV